MVIGLQSTGEARTSEAVLTRGEEMDEFVSGPRELLLKMVNDYFPMPTNPYDEAERELAELLDEGDEAYERELGKLDQLYKK